MKKKNVLALQKLSSKRPRGNHGGDGGSHLSVSGCGGDSGLSLLICD